MPKVWLEGYYKALKVLLLDLAALNGWIAYAILPKHPILAVATCTMALLIVLGVTLLCRVSSPN
jgi:hypothetical protein